LVVGFGAMVPFMNTGLFAGPVATRLDGADLSFYVGFVVAFCVYLALRKYEVPNAMLSRDGLRNRSEGAREEGSSV
jgi:purine-cytosine permease-like protein